VASGEAFAQATEIGRATGHAYASLAGLAMQARVRAEQGRLREADEAFRQSLRLLTEGGFELLPVAGVVRIGMADLRYERDDLDAAERELEGGVNLAERTGEVSTLVWAYVILSRTRRAQGDDKGALKIARRAEGAARDSGADLQIAIASSWMARLRLMRGELAEAATLEQERAAASTGAADAARRVDRMISARLLHARGRHREALGLLKETRDAVEAEGRARDLVEVLTLQALTLWESGEKERAVDAMADALELAAPEGYVRTFVDEGPPIVPLLSEALASRRGEQPSPPRRFAARYPRKLLTAIERNHARAASSAAKPPEPFSERELEVLRLIASGKSNRRIAEDLYVSMGTVKTHINNLYRKLDTHSRTQAVARARESGLL
jgi:LuxR family maltose regulon positive regulatory protein